MKIGKLSLQNYCSYKSLEFDFASQGLVGLFGSTGSGKSTLMDGLAWTLFGRSGKGTAADDVKTWDSEESAEGNLQLRLGSGVYLDLTRRRGGSGKSDLFWRESQDGQSDLSDPIRGKDLKDTQKRLEEKLGVTADLFFASAYMSQFSEADSFFVASAKARREVLEKIADQEWAIKLGERSADARKSSKSVLENLELELAKNTGALESLNRTLAQTRTNALQWDKNHAVRVAHLEAKCTSYAADTEAKAAEWEKANTATLDRLYAEISEFPEVQSSVYFDEEITRLKTETRCKSCGSLSAANNEAISKLREERAQVLALGKMHDNAVAAYQAEGAKENPHRVGENPYTHQLEEVRGDDNPFTANIRVYQDEIHAAEQGDHTLRALKEGLETRISHLTWLYDKSFEIRGLMMERVVREIQEKTNYYLEKFFDGILRVQFALEGSDKIEAHISNNGHRCPFPSLSGGERTQLKLAFSLSLMRAAQNKAGVSINVLLLDEPLNGLAEELKVKAFALFEELATEHETILVIDHSEAFKNCFMSRFTVDKSGDFSTINKDE